MYRDYFALRDTLQGKNFPMIEVPMFLQTGIYLSGIPTATFCAGDPPCSNSISYMIISYIKHINIDIFHRIFFLTCRFILL